MVLFSASASCAAAGRGKLKLVPLRCFNHGDKEGADCWAHYKLGAVAFWPYSLLEGQEGGHHVKYQTHTHTHARTHTDTLISQRLLWQKKTTLTLVINWKEMTEISSACLDFFMFDWIRNLPVSLLGSHMCTVYTSSRAQTLIFSVAGLCSLSSASSRWLTHACNILPLHAPHDLD